MIYQHRIRLETAERLPYGLAYRLYAWLLSQLPEETAERLHGQDGAHIAQYLQYQKETRENQWILNVPNEELEREIAAVLTDRTEIKLQNGEGWTVAAQEIREIAPQTLVFSGGTERYTRIEFLTPTAFKQAGRYAIFPTEALLLQSLTARWNELVPGLAVTDEDALHSLLQGIHITDYALRTTRYPLKGAKIPGFVGRLVIEAKLPLPMAQLWNALTGIADYAGLGMKTSLGMGGVAVSRAPQPFEKQKS